MNQLDEEMKQRGPPADVYDYERMREFDQNFLREEKERSQLRGPETLETLNLPEYNEEQKKFLDEAI